MIPTEAEVTAPRACPNCGSPSNAGDRFCIACGASLSDAPVTAERESAAPSHQLALADAPSVTPQAVASPSTPRRQRGTCLLVAALVALLLLGGPVAWIVWSWWQPAPARLIIWGAPHGLWQVSLEHDDNLRTIDDRDLMLPAGTYTIHLTPQGSFDAPATPESATFVLEPGCIHVYSASGEPVEVGTLVGDRWVHCNVGVPAPTPLRFDPRTDTLRWTTRKTDAGRPIDAGAEIQVSDAGRVVPADSGRWLAVANPYDEPLQVEVTDDPIRWRFRLPACSIRLVPCPAENELSIRASLPGDDEELDSLSIKRPPDATSLYTVGAATAYEWETTNESDRDSAAHQTVLPDQFVTLDDGTVARFRLPPLSERGSPGKPLVTRELTSGGRSRLFAVASAPLLAPVSQAPSELTTHPEVRVAVVPQPGELAGRAIQYLAARQGGAVVIADAAAYDLASGMRLHAAGPPLRAAAVGNDGLLLITRQGQLASVSDGGLVTGDSLGDPTLQIWARPADGRVFLFGGQSAGGLFTIEESRLRRLLPADQHVTALGAAPEGIVAALGRRIERLRFDGSSSELDAVDRATLVELPDGPDVVGLHDAGGLLVFATEEAVYMLSEGAVLPLVLGAGGPIYPHEGDLLMLDRNSRRLLLLKSDLFHTVRGD
jgi:hypothetical protein